MPDPGLGVGNDPYPRAEQLALYIDFRMAVDDVTTAEAHNPADRPLDGWIAHCRHHLLAGTDLLDHPAGQRRASSSRWTR